MEPTRDNHRPDGECEFRDKTRTIWRELKPGSLGLVQWHIERDERVVGAFTDALTAIDDLDRVALSLEYPVQTASNALGQVGLHQLAGDESRQPHVEPRDPRWGPLLAFSPETLQWTTRAIAYHPSFIAKLRRALGSTVATIKGGELTRSYDLHELPEARELYREFLICLGMALAHVVRSNEKTLSGLLGEIRLRGSRDQAPLFTFQKKPRDIYFRLGS